MLIHEQGDLHLWLLKATPRKWLEGGKTIEVQRASTCYGRMSMKVESHAASGSITAEIDMPDREAPGVLFVRLRHPEAKPIRSATINGKLWTDFDVQEEWVRIVRPGERHYSITTSY
jgi:hypothetical protein